MMSHAIGRNRISCLKEQRLISLVRPYFSARCNDAHTRSSLFLSSYFSSPLTNQPRLALHAGKLGTTGIAINISRSVPNFSMKCKGPVFRIIVLDVQTFDFGDSLIAAFRREFPLLLQFLQQRRLDGCP